MRAGYVSPRSQMADLIWPSQQNGRSLAAWPCRQSHWSEKCPSQGRSSSRTHFPAHWRIKVTQHPKSSTGKLGSHFGHVLGVIPSYTYYTMASLAALMKKSGSWRIKKPPAGMPHQTVCSHPHQVALFLFLLDPALCKLFIPSSLMSFCEVEAWSKQGWWTHYWQAWQQPLWYESVL